MDDFFNFNKLDVTDFNEALAESLVKEPTVSFEFLEKQRLIFTPFDLCVCLGDIFVFNKLDVTDFNEALAESLVKEPNVSFEFLEKQGLIFTPFDLNDKHDTPLYDIDLDIQLYIDQISGSLHSCDFYLEHMFNEKITTNNISNHCFSVLLSKILSNIRSFS